MKQWMSKEQPDSMEIKAWITEKMPDIVRDLKRICKIKSVAECGETDCPPYGQGCRDVLQEMLQMGRENGFETHNYENYVGRITYPGKTEENIGVWAHLDEVEEGKDWDYPPYEPTVKDNYFIARGCQDNKSSAIIGLYALKYMKEHGLQLNHTMELYLGTCEEQGMYELDYFLEHYKAPSLSLVPDSGFPVCCGERGSFNGELICKEVCSASIVELDCGHELYTIPGRTVLTIKDTEDARQKCKDLPKDIQAEYTEAGIVLTATGISTQASNPSKGKNALTILADFICERELLGETERKTFAFISDINRDCQGEALHVKCEDELSGWTTLVATRLKNVQGHLVIDFISKYPVTKNDYPFEQNASEAAEKRGFSLKTTRLSKANFFDPERREVKVLTQVSNEVLQRADKPFVMSGGTYARKLPNAFAFGTGMPLPKAPEGLFRPGHGDYHQPDESISLERVQKGLEIYIQGLLRLDFQ